MEVNTNSPNLQSDTINIFIEFAQQESDGVKENGEITNSYTDGAEHVFQILPTSSSPSQASSTSEINCSEIAAVDIQKMSRTTVVEQHKECVAGRNASKPSNLNLPVLSVSNPTILYPRRPSITSLQQPSISLHIESGKVTCTQLVHNKAKQGDVQNTSLARPVATSASEMRGMQISNATKLALKNFLKKKSAGNVSNYNKSGETDNETRVPEVAITLPVGEARNPSKKVKTCSDGGSIIERGLSNITTGPVIEETSAAVSISPHGEGENASKKDGTCPDCGNDKEKQPLDAVTGTEIEKLTSSLSVCESNSSNPVQFSDDFHLTSTTLQCDKSSSLSTQHADVILHDSEHKQESEQGSKDISMSAKELCPDMSGVSTSADISKEPSAPVTQEVDVVVLPSLLESDIAEQTTETSQESTQKKSGTKKKKTSKLHECVECGKVLSSRVYRDHMNIHYDIRPHKCSECGKSFRQRSHLEKHKLLHTGEKPYVCQYCGHGFRCRYAHRDHERIHTGEKPCKCNLCGKMFRSLNIVSDHQRSVHKVRPSRSWKSTRKTSYKCGICNKTFSWSSALSMHKKIHSDVYAYKCLKCPKVFKHYSNLWNHKQSHSKEKPFECDLCGQRLKRRGNLKRHILTQHDPEEAEHCLKTSKQFKGYHTKKAKEAI